MRWRRRFGLRRRRSHNKFRKFRKPARSNNTAQARKALSYTRSTIEVPARSLLKNSWTISRQVLKAKVGPKNFSERELTNYWDFYQWDFCCFDVDSIIYRHLTFYSNHGTNQLHCNENEQQKCCKVEEFEMIVAEVECGETLDNQFIKNMLIFCILLLFELVKLLHLDYAQSSHLDCLFNLMPAIVRFFCGVLFQVQRFSFTMQDFMWSLERGWNLLRDFFCLVRLKWTILFVVACFEAHLHGNSIDLWFDSFLTGHKASKDFPLVIIFFFQDFFYHPFELLELVADCCQELSLEH